MALTKIYDIRDHTWHNNNTPALNETNLNALSQAVSDIDDRVIELGVDVLETVPLILAKYADIEALSENPPYIGANGNWYVWDTNTGEYVDSGIDASITVEIADVTALEPDASPYVTNTGTNTDPIFHLFIPRGQNGQVGATPNISVTASVDSNTGTPSVTVTKTGTAGNPKYALAFSNLKGERGIQGDKGNTGETGATGNGIASIERTGTSGLVDTYTITFTDGTTTTFTVTNGRDGQGSGDMLEADYDSNGTVKSAGGIDAYVDDEISGKANKVNNISVAMPYAFLDSNGDLTKSNDVTYDKVRRVMNSNYYAMEYVYTQISNAAVFTFSTDATIHDYDMFEVFSSIPNESPTITQTGNMTIRVEFDTQASRIVTLVWRRYAKVFN